MLLAARRPSLNLPAVRLVLLAVVAALLAATTSISPLRTPAPDWRSDVTVAADYVKSVDTSVKLTTAQLVTLITDMRNSVKGLSENALPIGGGKGMAIPMVTYWNSTYWFGHWDVAMLAGLSATAVVAILLTTGPIGVATAWGIVGAIMGIIATAFFSGYCAYYVVTQRRAGTYHC